MADKKEGFTVKEIEGFAKRHGSEITLIGSFFLAMIFGHVFFRKFSLPMAGVGAILGVLLSSRVELYTRKCFHFFFQKDETTRLVLQLVCLILSIFLPLLVFLVIGLHAGKSLHHMALEAKAQERRSKE